MSEWRKAALSGDAAEVPLIGQAVVLHCRPHKRDEAWMCDIGSLDCEIGSPDCEEEAELVWGSAFGLYSAFDGVKFEDILKEYEVCFAEVPPLAESRFPVTRGNAADSENGLSASA